MRAADTAARALDVSAARPGDIIFVYSKSKGAFITRAGQWVIRRLFGRKPKAPRFSHVALVIEPMIAVHAAPGVVRTEPPAAIMPSAYGPGVRVARKVSPALMEGEQIRLADRARFFLSQRYAFLFGQRSLRLGRVIRAIGYRRDAKTLPFCSHLVADAYESIGHRILRLSADQVLPLDLDEACRPPIWGDVTDEYYPAPESMEGIDAAFAELLAPKPERDLQIASMAAQLPGAMYDMVAGAAGLLSSTRQLAAFHLASALEQSHDAASLLTLGQKQLLTELERLPGMYAQLERGEGFIPPSVMANLRAQHPRSGDDDAPYEALPTWSDLKRQEHEQDVLMTGARLVRLQTLLLACLVGVGAIKVDDGPYNGVTLDLALPLFKAAPSLDEARGPASIVGRGHASRFIGGAAARDVARGH